TDHEVRVGIPSPQHLNDVAHGGPVKRGDDADLARKRRQRTLAVLVEEALGSESLLQLFKSELQRTETFWLEVLAEDLIFALGIVDAHAASRDHPQAV